MKKIEQVSFSVDAGIINRLGLELVAKSETAVAELIKNAYDADANVVNLFFENANIPGGTLLITDDGNGMDKGQLIDGFMRLATSDKIHNSISERYQRPKAGRKGIGRFSTQRLGETLIIKTKSQNSPSLELEINWNMYAPDTLLSNIKNNLTTLENTQGPIGTKLLIKDLRDKWSDADIKRVYRYVADLIQPSYLSVGDNNRIIEESKDESFEVNFLRRQGDQKDWSSVADPSLMMLDRALATITGYIDANGIGVLNLSTKKFKFDEVESVLHDTFQISSEPFHELVGASIAFKAYYYIGGDRNSYYGITKSELKVITDHLKKNGGIKLYRNGFRVPKYGEIGNDWLSLDTKSRIGGGIPFSNNHLLGFVQLIDPDGKIFEESAGREGLIEKEAFRELQSFISSAIETGFLNFISWFRRSDEYKALNPDRAPTPKVETVNKSLSVINNATKVLTSLDTSEEEKKDAALQLEQATRVFVSTTKSAINELEMMRVLAGVGLTIAEFIHEIKQIIPSTLGYVEDTLKKNISKDIAANLENINEVLASLLAYTSYFDDTISGNVIRELKPINLRTAIKSFQQVINADLIRRHIILETKMEGKDLIIKSIHPSEVNTILQNLYSNAKKAILKNSGKRGKILIRAQKDEKNGTVVLDFQDNGIGIPAKNKDRIFDAFFTTATDRKEDYGTSTGLGLHILNQMIQNRSGKIELGEPDPDYKTLFKITLPLGTKEDLR
ncbi:MULTISPECIES: sensor histidine kinase [unclassified Sphingobacterium]|uniref:sensor histidine kinase n=1 Tax=unclassified Sphingobacterium TaxID=2609468 RepID=UPI0025DD63A1|nr:MULTISPECIES: sensor histidine kinase [unclassified Sphingobacterium]